MKKERRGRRRWVSIEGSMMQLSDTGGEVISNKIKDKVD